MGKLRLSGGKPGYGTLTDTEEQLTGGVTAVSNMDEVTGWRAHRPLRYSWRWKPRPDHIPHNATVTIGEFVCCSEGTFEAMTDTTMKASITGNGSLEVEGASAHEGDYADLRYAAVPH